MRNDDWTDWYREEYERYVADPDEDRRWDVAKYNPYAAYMFGLSAERGEIDGDPGAYFRRSADRGCPKALWKVVSNPYYMSGPRDLCGMFRVVTQSEGGWSEGVVEEAERRAAEHPVLWLLLAYNDLCEEDHESFMRHSEEACLRNIHPAMYLRAGRLLEMADEAEGDEARGYADEAVRLLTDSMHDVWESCRALGELRWTGRWVERDRRMARDLFERSAAMSGRGTRDLWVDYIWNTPERLEGLWWEREPSMSDRVGLYSCAGIQETSEWRVLMRVTRTDEFGMTAIKERKGVLGGYEDDVFAIRPFDYAPGAAFLEFKPTGVRVYDYDDPVTDSKSDMDTLRWMLRACVESASGAGD